MARRDGAQVLGEESELVIDHFGLHLGAVSVGLPLAGTTDDVLRRYLELLRVVHGPRPVEPPADDLVALSEATRTEPAWVARRLTSLRHRG